MKIIYAVTDRDRIDRGYSHELLEIALNKYVGMEAIDVDVKMLIAGIAETGNGKPVFANQTNPELHFSISHSGRFWAVAIDHETCGLDIQIEVPVNYGRIAGKYYPPEDTARLEMLKGQDRVSEFYRIWTRREAYLKAVGSTVFSNAGDYGREAGWLVRDVEMPFEAQAAVCMRSNDPIEIIEI